MTRRYVNLLPLLISTADGSYAQGEEFDFDFTEADEYARVQSGLIGVVPAAYKVVGGSVVHGHKPGETFEKALTIGEERMLVEGGHIERLEDKKQAAKPPAKKKGE